MGSEGPKEVIIHVTGFKKFHGVAENPTETIVNKLKDFVAKKGLPAGVKLGSCTVLETAGVGALPMLQNIFESSMSKMDVISNELVVWLHLGVNGAAKNFAIERQAINEASFLCPDELGWQPERVEIAAEDGTISQLRLTSCSVEAIHKFLTKKGHDVTISEDAGRFVCNYVYYQSLRSAEHKGNKSLFVHVPPFSRINEETQLHFIASLLEAIPLAC